MFTILLVCTGNTCRSPMAEGLLREKLRGRSDVRVVSAGLSAVEGRPVSRYAREVMKELGIDISDIRSQMVTEELVKEADLILTMTTGHLDGIVMLYPEASEKTYLLREFDSGVQPHEREVSDPIGQSIEVYRECRDQMALAVPGILKEIERRLSSSADEKRADFLFKRVALGADHGGVEVKAFLVSFLRQVGIEVVDVGTQPGQEVDYPDCAVAVCETILSGRAEVGVLICRTGIGMSMTVNKFPGIRAALVHRPRAARWSREHHDANVLCLAADEVSKDEAAELLRLWLQTPFEGGGHERRVKKMGTVTEHCPTGVQSDPLEVVDSQIAEAIRQERHRQTENIELIASENFTSRAVMEAQGSCLTNKYAEGYPGKRWYGGCEHVDVVEQLAIDRAKKLFGAQHANVQPHSGSQANMAVYFSVLNPGDKIMTMDLAHGGHLTHGHKMNFSGRLFEVLHYGVSPETFCLDYDDLEAKAKEFRPKMITVGASAYSRTIDFARMGEIARSVGAYLFADIAHIAGLVAAGLHPSPVPHADFVTTTTHKTLRGPRGGLILCREEHAKAVDSQVFPGCQGGPLMHIIAAKAVCFLEAMQPAFQAYQKQVVLNAKALADAMTAHGYSIISGTTDNHVMLVDLQPRNLTGKDAQEALDHAGITVNKNAVPFDRQPLFKAGGIRLGTPAVTSRGMREAEMRQIATWIHQALENRANRQVLASIRDEVRAMTSRFPIPG